MRKLYPDWIHNRNFFLKIKCHKFAIQYVKFKVRFSHEQDGSINKISLNRDYIKNISFAMLFLASLNRYSVVCFVSNS